MNEPTARVEVIDGQPVLIDPVAVGVMDAINKHACRKTFEAQSDRVQHFVGRAAARGMTADSVVIVLLNVDDPNGGELASCLMPGNNWQQFRDAGEVPFARGLAGRSGVLEWLEALDKPAAEKLAAMTTLAVVVMDYGAVEVFEAQPV